MQETYTLEKHLSTFCGTTQYHRYSRQLVLTDGARYFAEKAQAFWFVSIIDSILPKLHKENFLCVKIEKILDNSAHVEITDGNDKYLYSQRIEYTDFPMKSIDIYVQRSTHFWVMMLTSEY